MTLKISNPKRDLLKNFTGIFKIQNCDYCKMYEQFIEEIKLNLPPKINFEIIDCTNYHDYEIEDDKRIPIFLKYYQGSYPTMFVNGRIVPGANTVEELRAWITAYFSQDFITEENHDNYANGKNYPFLFSKECYFSKNKKNRGHIECQGK